MARVLKGSHSFTCTPRVHPLTIQPATIRSKLSNATSTSVSDDERNLNRSADRSCIDLMEKNRVELELAISRLPYVKRAPGPMRTDVMYGKPNFTFASASTRRRHGYEPGRLENTACSLSRFAGGRAVAHIATTQCDSADDSSQQRGVLYRYRCRYRKNRVVISNAVSSSNTCIEK